MFRSAAVPEMRPQPLAAVADVKDIVDGGSTRLRRDSHTPGTIRIGIVGETGREGGAFHFVGAVPFVV